MDRAMYKYKMKKSLKQQFKRYNRWVIWKDPDFMKDSKHLIKKSNLTRDELSQVYRLTFKLRRATLQAKLNYLTISALLLLLLWGCGSTPPQESEQPSSNRAAVQFCERNPEHVLCQKM